MKYAIISVSGSQFQVFENQVLTIDKQQLGQDKEGKINEVLLIVDDLKIKIGNPTIKDASILYQVIKNYKGKKLRVFKYKAKSRYRRTLGFRPQLTDIKIKSISY